MDAKKLTRMVGVLAALGMLVSILGAGVKWG
jgi:hypothetical protein